MSATHSAIHRRRRRATLLWGLGFFLAAQLGLSLTQRWDPTYRDPLFGEKLFLLQQQRAARPGRPLVLFLGTSRFIFGIRPDVLSAALPADRPEPVVFNFGEIGAGPIFNLLYLNRLLQRGIRPQCLFVEVWPLHLSKSCQHVEEDRLAGQALEWCDLRVLRGFTEYRPDDWRRWLVAQVAPWYATRLVLLRRWAEGWLPPGSGRPSSVDIDEQGWHGAEGLPEGPEKHHLVHAYQRSVEPTLHSLVFSPVEDRALREVLATCRRQGIAVALVFMPEGPDFQSWYPPALRAEVDRYLGGLSRQYRVPYVDARNWAPDTALVDSFHLNRAGATAFSERFGREVLRPLLEGRPVSCAVTSGNAQPCRTR